MPLDSLDTFYNMLLFLFWFKIWNTNDRSLFFNPYLGPLDRISSAIIRFLRPVFGPTPPRIVAAVSLVFLLVFRAAIYYGTVRSGQSSWRLVMGQEASKLTDWRFPMFLVFTVISFGIFLFKLWGISVLYIQGKKRAAFNRTSGTLATLSQPFASLSRPLQPVALFIMGFFLALFLSITAESFSEFPAVLGPEHAALAARCAASTLIQWVTLLPMLGTLVFVVIIGSWIGHFTRSSDVMLACREWLDMLMGPFRRIRFQIASFDLSPILFMFAINLIYGLLLAILSASYAVIP